MHVINKYIYSIRFFNCLKSPVGRVQANMLTGFIMTVSVFGQFLAYRVLSQMGSWLGAHSIGTSSLICCKIWCFSSSRLQIIHVNRTKKSYISFTLTITLDNNFKQYICCLKSTSITIYSIHDEYQRCKLSNEYSIFWRKNIAVQKVNVEKQTILC